jgi:hypothetical protein
MITRAIISIFDMFGVDNWEALLIVVHRFGNLFDGLKGVKSVRIHYSAGGGND